MKQKAVPKKQKRDGFLGRLWGRFAFFGNIVSELRKVNWPSRRDVARLSVIVVIIAAVMGGLLWSFDYGFSKLVDVLLLR